MNDTQVDNLNPEGIAVGDYVWFKNKGWQNNPKMFVTQINAYKAECIWINGKNTEENSTYSLILLTKVEPEPVFFA